MRLRAPTRLVALATGCAFAGAMLGRAVPADAQAANWLDIGLQGGPIATLAADPSIPGTVYAGTGYNRVFKTTDGGDHWASASDGLAAAGADFTIGALAVDPSQPGHVFAGDPKGHVFRSFDGGNTWTLVDNGLPPAPIEALLVKPGSGVVIAATAQGIFRSRSQGRRWLLASPRPAGCLAVDPAPSAALYACAPNELLRSTDNGATWNSVNIFAFSFTAIAMPRHATVLVAFPAGMNSGILRSTDDGATFSELEFPGLERVIGPFTALAAPPRTHGLVYTFASVRGGLLVSRDFGDTWAPAQQQPADEVVGFAVDASSPFQVYAGTYSAGVFRTADGGASWSPASAGLAADHVAAVAANPQRPNIVYTAGSAGIQKSRDRGGHWVRLPVRADSGIAVDPAFPRHLLAGVELGGPLRSDDAGASWTDPFGQPLRIAVVAFDPQTPDLVYGGGRGLFQSGDGGTVWSPVGLPAGESAQIDDLAVTADGTLFAAGSLSGESTGFVPQPRIYKIVPGASAVRSDAGFSSGTVGRIAADPLNPDILYAASTQGATGIWKTADGGATWTPLAAPEVQTAYDVVLLAGDGGNTLYAAVEQGLGLVASADGGATWTPVPLPPDADTTGARLTATGGQLYLLPAARLFRFSGS